MYLIQTIKIYILAFIWVDIKHICRCLSSEAKCSPYYQNTASKASLVAGPWYLRQTSPIILAMIWAVQMEFFFVTKGYILPLFGPELIFMCKLQTYYNVPFQELRFSYHGHVFDKLIFMYNLNNSISRYLPS